MLTLITAIAFFYFVAAGFVWVGKFIFRLLNIEVEE